MHGKGVISKYKCTGTLFGIREVTLALICGGAIHQSKRHLILFIANLPKIFWDKCYRSEYMYCLTDQVVQHK